MPDLDAYITETIKRLLATVKRSPFGYYWESNFLNTELQLQKKVELGIFSGVSGNLLFLLAQGDKRLNHCIYGASNWLYNTSMENRIQDSSFATGYLGIVWVLLKVAEHLNADIYRVCAYQVFQNQSKRRSRCPYYNPVDYLIVLTQLWVNTEKSSLREGIQRHLNNVCQEWKDRKHKKNAYYLIDVLYILRLLKAHSTLNIDSIVLDIEEQLYQISSGQHLKGEVLTDASWLKETISRARYGPFKEDTLHGESYTVLLSDQSIAKAWLLASLRDLERTGKMFTISGTTPLFQNS